MAVRLRMTTFVFFSSHSYMTLRVSDVYGGLTSFWIYKNREKWDVSSSMYGYTVTDQHLKHHCRTICSLIGRCCWIVWNAYLLSSTMMASKAWDVSDKIYMVFPKSNFIQFDHPNKVVLCSECSNLFMQLIEELLPDSRSWPSLRRGPEGNIPTDLIHLWVLKSHKELLYSEFSEKKWGGWRDGDSWLQNYCGCLIGQFG